jgi:hypothetical protein
MNKPFEGDTYIKQEIIKLRDIHALKLCVETGTQYGSTTLELHDIFKNVCTIEADEKHFNLAKERFKGLNIYPHLGLSTDSLNAMRFLDDIFYYLDAHGGDIGGCPLKNELEAIASNEHKNVCIAIHDFKVPGKDFGFDTYDFELCYEEVESYLKMIYPNGFSYHYNSEADGARQGIIYIYPQK